MMHNFGNAPLVMVDDEEKSFTKSGSDAQDKQPDAASVSLVKRTAYHVCEDR